MQNVNSLIKPIQLMIVAHPDDEVLFGGAQLILDKYTVLCVTNGDNVVRRKEFELVMETLGCSYEIWDYPDRQFEYLPCSLECDLDFYIRSQCWNKIVTHNQYGEYGHIHHRQINQLVKKLSPTRNLWHFNYHKSNFLDKDLWIKKLELMKLYRSQKDRIDFILSGKKQVTVGYSDYLIQNEILSQEHFFI